MPIWFARSRTRVRPRRSGMPQESGIPYAMGIIRNAYVGPNLHRTSPAYPRHGRAPETERQSRDLFEGKRVILVDDSVVRGTTSQQDQGDGAGRLARSEVHFRIASPPTRWSCFYGVDTPEREKLLAARMDEDAMCEYLGVDSLRFVSLDGLYRACGHPAGRNKDRPQFCDACFSGQYPIEPVNMPEGANIREEVRI